MNRKQTLFAAALIALSTAAVAQDGAYHYFNHGADGFSAQSARNFAIEDRILQEESTNMPAGSPRVDRTVPAADPLPAATTPAEEIARFRTMDKTFTAESLSSASGSAPVDRTQPAADPVPKGSAAAEERFLQQNSTP